MQLVERTARRPVAAAFLAPELPELDAPGLSFALRTALCRMACEESDFAGACSWGWESSRTSERIIQQLTAKLSWSGGLRWEFEPWCLVTRLEADNRQADVRMVYIGQSVTAPASVHAVTGLEAKVRQTRLRRYDHLSPVLASQSTSLLIKDDWEPTLDPGLVSSRVLEHLRSALEADSLEMDLQLPEDGEHGSDESHDEGTYDCTVPELEEVKKSIREVQLKVG